MKKLIAAAAVVSAFVALPGAASASTLVNAGFEAGAVGSGAPAGWFTLNPFRVQTVTSFGSYLPQEGSQFAVLAAGLRDIPTILSQIFTMTQGETLSFMVAFATSDALPFNDRGALGIFDFSAFSGSTLFSQSVSSVGNGASGPWTKISFTAPTTGLYALNATVRNDGNSRFPSYLLLDAPGGVPEPGTWMLMLLGLGAIGFAVRQRKNTRISFV